MTRQGVADSVTTSRSVISRVQRRMAITKGLRGRMRKLAASRRATLGGTARVMLSCSTGACTPEEVSALDTVVPSAQVDDVGGGDGLRSDPCTTSGARPYLYAAARDELSSPVRHGVVCALESARWTIDPGGSRRKTVARTNTTRTQVQKQGAGATSPGAKQAALGLPSVPKGGTLQVVMCSPLWSPGGGPLYVELLSIQ